MGKGPAKAVDAEEQERDGQGQGLYLEFVVRDFAVAVGVNKSPQL